MEIVTVEILKKYEEDEHNLDEWNDDDDDILV